MAAAISTDAGGSDEMDEKIFEGQLGQSLPCNLLTAGLMEQIIPQMRILKEKLGEVDQSQKVMIDSLQQENEKISQWNARQEIETYMAEVKYYQNKLVQIRKTMIAVTEKTAKMKMRAEKLKMKKDKQDQKEQERRRKLEEKERSLIAKSAKSSSEDVK